MKHLIIPTVNVAIINGSKILLSRRANTGWMDGYLCLPGGHVEEGETPCVAILREIKEELGITVQPDDLVFSCVVVRNTTPQETVAYEFTIRDKAYEPKNTEPERCSELVWVDLDELPADLIDDFKQIIKKGIKEKVSYFELGYKIDISHQN